MGENSLMPTHQALPQLHHQVMLLASTLLASGSILLTCIPCLVLGETINALSYLPIIKCRMQSNLID